MNPNPNESHSHKNAKNKATPVAQPTTEKNIPKDPPGVHMPSEREMSPPQFG